MVQKLARFVSPVALAVVFAPLGACTIDAPSEEAESEFREAVPAGDSVRLDGPESTTASGMEAAASTRGTMAPSAGQPAFWYTFTRNVRDGVNAVTAVVLVSVWAVVHTTPTELDEDHAVFGPFEGDALDPVRYRLTVTRIGEHHFRYVLEGQAKAAGAGSAFLTVLDGDGHSKKSPSHGDGAFTLDLDNARILDPSRHADDAGTVTIEHDLPADIGRRRNALPRFVSANIQAAGGEWLEIHSAANEDGTGSLDLTGSVDIDESHATLPEAISVQSRWRSTGAGRSDIEFAGGDVPLEYDPVTAVECWGTDFTRVYYVDSAGLAPTEGVSGECAYEAP